MKHETTSRHDIPPTTQPSTHDFIDTETLELLASWQLEDATENVEEVRAAEQELADFKRAMNEYRLRAGESLLYP